MFDPNGGINEKYFWQASKTMPNDSNGVIKMMSNLAHLTQKVEFILKIHGENHCIHIGPAVSFYHDSLYAHYTHYTL